MHKMRPVDRFDQDALIDEVLDIRAIDDRVESEVQLIGLIVRNALGRCRQAHELGFGFAVCVERVDDPLISSPVWGDPVRLIHDDKISLRYGVG